MNFKELFTDLYFEYSTLSPSTPFIDRTANIFIHTVCKVLFILNVHIYSRVALTEERIHVSYTVSQSTPRYVLQILLQML